MISWATVVVALSLVFLIYFLVRGIRIALSNKELPDPEEGDYDIKVIGKVGSKGLLTIMRPRNDKDS